MSGTDDKTRVAILGGGCGALAAAFWLSATPALRQRYAVTVYTDGWRLGGKAASGRNSARHDRIEEHGLHLMLGFYDTVFYTMRAAYAAMDKPPDAAFADWRQAFTPQRSVTLWFADPPGEDKPWLSWTPRFPDLPGFPGDERPQLDPDDESLGRAVDELVDRLVNRTLARVHELLGEHRWLGLALDRMLRRMDRQLLQPAVDELDLLEAQARRRFLRLLRLWQRWFKWLLAPALRRIGVKFPDLAWECRLCSQMIDLSLAGLIGLLNDVAPFGEEGYARINGLDFKDWLVSHKADPASTRSPMVMCLYDLAFAYRDGDSSDPANGQAAAGAFLRLIQRMAFDYRDAPLWRMNAGMGDIIFTPLYSLLRDHGVRFEFFHRVTELRLSGDRQQIDEVEIQRQAELKTGDYAPLERLRFSDGKQWDCWPAQPHWSQLVDGERLRRDEVDFEDPWCQVHAGTRTLNRGQDYDLLVLGIPPAASAPLSARLRCDDGWSAMLDHSHSVATRSVQLWLNADDATLGWPHAPSVATCYAHALRSWATMGQLLATEHWPDGGGPKACEYLCGTFTPTRPGPPPGAEDPDYVPGQARVVEQQAQSWLNQHYAPLWPAAAAPGGFDWNRVQSSYYRANVAWSQLYVQSLPGTVRYRLDPGDSGFRNLYLAGDWTRTSINGGCAEAAFESGLRAACAISGEPPPEPDFG